METQNLDTQTNKKVFDFHKVFAAVGVILIAMILVCGGVWYFVQSAEDKAGTVDENTVIKTTTSPAKKATESAKKDETADWKTYTNTYISYSVKIPTSWVNSSCEKNLDFFAPNKEQVGICNSGFGGIINFEKEINNYDTALASYKKAENLKNSKVSSVTVSGKEATKVTGTSTLEGFENYTYITYILEKDGKALHLSYFANPTWTDQTKIFEQMVSTFKFL